MKFSRYNLQLNFAEIKLPRAPSRSDSHVLFPLSAIILTVNGNGDGEIRTLDPLLARQVLSQLSYTPIWNIVNFLFLIWQPPAFPYRHQYSIIGRFRLNHRVRDVDGCFPKAHRHQKFEVI